MFEISLLTQTRTNLLSLIKNLTDEQWLIIPESHNNNILWNLGHMVATQQVLHYQRSQIPTIVSETDLAPYRKGTSPKEWTHTPNKEQVINWFPILPIQLEKDYKKSSFVHFEPYTTSSGILINSIEGAIAFNNYHEGLHTGTIMSLLKIVKH